KVVTPLQYVVTGSQTLTITVEKRPMDMPGRSTPEIAAPAPAAPATSSAPADTTPASTAHSHYDIDALSDASGEAGTPLDMAGEGPTDSQSTLPTAPPPPPSLVPAPAPTSAVPAPLTKPGPAGASTPSAGTGKAAPPESASTAPPGDTTAKPVGRTASIWRQSGATDFVGGTLAGASVNSRGGITLAPSLVQVAATNTPYAWSLATGPAGSQLVGTGDNGTIYKIDSSGHVAVFFHTGALEVTSLAVDDHGNFYAGTIPDGVVYRIAPDGHGAAWFTAPEKFITALAFDGAGHRLFVATGGGTGRVYAVPESFAGRPKAKTDSLRRASCPPPSLRSRADSPPDGLGSSPSANASGVGSLVYLNTAEAHILSVAVDAQGVLYAGTAPDGLLYRVDTTGKVAVLYQAAEANLTGVAVNAAGVYAASGPHGSIVRIAPDGRATTVYSSSSDSIAALAAGSGPVYAVTGNKLLAIEPDDTVDTFLGPTGEQFISLNADGASVDAGTATGGSVYRLNAAAGLLTGQFESTLFDAGKTARWGTIGWRSDTASGTGVTLQTRSGDVSPADDSWSPWSTPITAPGSPVPSPPARYLQYRAQLTSTGAGFPRLDSVAVYYLPRNAAPTVKIASPKEGDIVAKSATLEWSATDPDHDTLTYDVSYSADGGKTWKPITKRWRPAAHTPSSTSAPASSTASGSGASAKPSPAAAHSIEAMRDDMSAHPELPAAVQAQILAQESARLAASDPAADDKDKDQDKGASNLRETSFNWDTTEVPDGAYVIQVIASDRASEPADPLSDRAVSGVFTVANAVPTVTTSAPTVNSDRTVTIRGVAASTADNIQAVQYTVDAGDPLAAAADSGLFDTSHEPFTLTTTALPPGDHKIDITVFDWAANTAVTTVKVTIH
ncbi:MAG: hypothetical protein ACLQVD_11610, partial [Capsulimonadaceae bacterium]